MKLHSQSFAVLLFIITLLPSILLADDASTFKGPIGTYAITFKRLPSGYDSTVWMQKQTRDQKLQEQGKILVSGIFQDTAQETFTILQPMTHNEAEQIMNDDPVIKAGLYSASIRPFTCYAPGVVETLPKKAVQEVK